MSRLRAVENGRTVVHGLHRRRQRDRDRPGRHRVVQRSSMFTRTCSTATVPLRASRTLATPAAGVAGVAARGAGILGARRGLPGSRTRRRRRPWRDGAAGGPSAATTAEASVGRVLVIIPTYNERENLAADRGPACALPSPTPTCSSSTTPARTAPATSPTRWPPRDAAVHVLHRPGKAGLGAAYLAGFALGAGARLRRPGRDGRRRLAPAGAAAPAARSASPTVPTWCHRVALGARGRGRELAAVARQAAQPRRQPVRPARARHRRCTTPPAATGPTGASDAGEARRSTRSRRRATASRSTSPGARCGAGLRVVEVPITFVERELGASKMSGAIVREALTKMTVWGVRHRAGADGCSRPTGVRPGPLGAVAELSANQARRRARPPSRPPGPSAALAVGGAGPAAGARGGADRHRPDRALGRRPSDARSPARRDRAGRLAGGSGGPAIMASAA